MSNLKLIPIRANEIIQDEMLGFITGGVTSGGKGSCSSNSCNKNTGNCTGTNVCDINTADCVGGNTCKTNGPSSELVPPPGEGGGGN